MSRAATSLMGHYRTLARQQLFDHLVGTGENRGIKSKELADATVN
jgi:hypothetical protein